MGEVFNLMTVIILCSKPSMSTCSYSLCPCIHSSPRYNYHLSHLQSIDEKSDSYLTFTYMVIYKGKLYIFFSMIYSAV